MYSDADRVKTVDAEAKRLEQYLSALSPEDWQRPSACDQWQVADVVAHLTGMRVAETIARGLQGDLSPHEDLDVSPRTDLSMRERIAQGSMAFRERLGDQLLSAFMTNNAHLAQVLVGLAPHDWETLCYRVTGPAPVRTLIDIRITELALHGWDIRSRFETHATLSVESLPALLTMLPRMVRGALRPQASHTIPVRYRFVVTTPVAVRQDIVLSREGARCEPASDSQADVTFRCAADTYVLVMFGRLAMETVIRDGRLAYAGPPELVTAFGQAFVEG
jgi:uncharacterized protein (TIGR03083 family)